MVRHYRPYRRKPNRPSKRRPTSPKPDPWRHSITKEPQNPYCDECRPADYEEGAETARPWSPIINESLLFERIAYLRQSGLWSTTVLPTCYTEEPPISPYIGCFPTFYDNATKMRETHRKKIERLRNIANEAAEFVRTGGFSQRIRKLYKISVQTGQCKLDRSLPTNHLKYVMSLGIDIPDGSVQFNDLHFRAELFYINCV